MGDVYPNPLTGDPIELENDGTTYSETSNAIADAIEEIRQLGSDRFSSHAVTSLDRSQGDVVEKITRIQYRYHEAGGALLAYAKALRQAQEQAARAVAAHGQLTDQADFLVARIGEEARLAGEPGPDQMLHIVQLQQLMAEQREVQAQQANALAIWNDAKGQKDAAAQTARIAIHVADEKNDLNDDLWDSLAALVPVLLLIDKIAQAVLKIVALVMTILAIVFAVLSLLLPILSPVAAALFGYAMLVNLAVAVLALLAFFMDGFKLLDLALVAIAVAATFGSGLLGDFLGAAADAAISTAMTDVSSTAGQVLGALAKNAITEGLKDVTKDAVDDVLFHGSNEAQQLFDDIGPASNAFLNTEFASQVTDIKALGTGFGSLAGTYGQFGLNAVHLPGLLHAPFNQLSSFADHGGLGNLQWAKDGWDAVHDHVITPLHQMQQAASGLAGNITGADADQLFSRLDGPGSAHFTAGDVAGDKLGDVVHDGAVDWASAASHGHWGGAAQWVVGHGNVLLPGPADTTAGAIGDAIGDSYGDIQNTAQSNIIAAHVPQQTWGPKDWSADWSKGPL